MSEKEKGIRYIDHIYQYEELVGAPSLHPLVSVIDLSRCHKVEYVEKMVFGFYAIFLKDVECGSLRYGRQYYDYQKGTIIFMAPTQILDVEYRGKIDEKMVQPEGYALLFDPQIIHGTPLAHTIQRFSYFSYSSNEAVHLSEKEHEIFMECLTNIQKELERGVDQSTKRILSSAIQLTLEYCQRFYDRQFITREDANMDILSRFENYVREYYSDNRAQKEGIISVNLCADHLNLTPNYLGDLIKKETGRTPQDHLQYQIMNLAKDRLLQPDTNVSEVAYSLGYNYPQHFTRAFRQAVGMSPKEYRVKFYN